MLTDKQLAALRAGHKNGYLTQPHGLVRLKLVQKRALYDEVRRRNIPTGDYELTGWGGLVAANYKASVERLPVGTRINHRIHAYARGTIQLADDSNSISTVARNRPIRVSGGGRGEWLIPLTGGGHTIASPEEAWYVRNLLKMDIELRLGEYGSPNDFGERL